MDNINEMDKDKLGQLIRFNAHLLDMVTKCDKTDTNTTEKEYNELIGLLKEWKKREYSSSKYILWAKEKIKLFERWQREERKIIDRPMHGVDLKNVTDVFSSIKNRRSIRFWKNNLPPINYIEQIIEAGTYAPSAFNRQAWKFVVIENNNIGEEEGDSTNDSMLKRAPIKIYVAIDERLYEEQYAPSLDAGLAIQNMLLAAHSLGLGACILYQCESVNQIELKKVLGLDEYHRIYALILLGYPAENPVTPERVSLDEVVQYKSC